MQITKKLLGVVSCVDDNSDDIRVIEGLVSNTSVINIKSTNTSYTDSEIKKTQTEVILNKKKAIELNKILEKWINS